MNLNQPDIDQQVDFHIPQRHYSPAEVVALQVESIRDATASLEHLTTCYSLASPKNREVTGPIDRFAEMIMTPPYDRLARSQAWQIGRAVIQDDHAAVLVSTISSDGDEVAFRFFLQLHSEDPFGGCWLTEAVQALERDIVGDESFLPKKDSSLE